MKLPEPFTIRKREDSATFSFSLSETSGLPRKTVLQWRRKSFRNLPDTLGQFRRPRSMAEARRAAFALIAYLKNPFQESREEPEAENGQTFREFLDPYYIPGRCPHIERVKGDRGSYSDRWAKTLRAAIGRHVLTDEISGKTTGSLKPGDFEDLKSRLRKKDISARTVNIILGALKAALKEGYYRGDIPHDPSAGVGKLREDSRETGIFTREETGKIFADPKNFESRTKNFSKGRGSKDTSMAYVFFLVCALTGERPNAILSLRWKDIGEGEIHFSTTQTHIKGRDIPVVPAVSAALEALKESARNKNPTAGVFGYADGSRCTRTWYRKRFNAMLKKTGIPGEDPDGRKRIPYSFKHSFITHLIDGGADEIRVREYVGHSHGYGGVRLLTRTQEKYKHRQAQKLRELLPDIEGLYKIPRRFTPVVTLTVPRGVTEYHVVAS
jgi:integrase